MNYLTKQLFRNWNLARILRLIIGISLLVQAIQTQEFLFGIGAGLFLFQAFTNIGCGGGACALPSNKDVQESKPEKPG